mgnify:CR=1 FL=1
MELEPFLSAYLEHPKFEHLIKTGFFRLATGLAYRRYQSCELDETQDRTHRLLGVMAEDVPFLRSLDPDMDMLRTFQEYCRLNLKDRQKLLLWQRDNKVERDILKILAHITPHKLMRYLDSQYAFLSLRKTKSGTLRYSSMQDLVSEYRDYLEMCVKQDYDMRNSFVLYPKDLQKSHDKVAHRIKMKADARMRRDFKKAYHDIAGQMDFEMDGMKILYPATPDEIISEGNTLHHCVGGYVDRVARKECIILFLRQCAEESSSFYTIEVREREIIQVRGMKNAAPTPEVEKFMRQWKKKVLEAPTSAFSSFADRSSRSSAKECMSETIVCRSTSNACSSLSEIPNLWGERNPLDTVHRKTQPSDADSLTIVLCPMIFLPFKSRASIEDARQPLYAACCMAGASSTFFFHCLINFSTSGVGAAFLRMC